MKTHHCLSIFCLSLATSYCATGQVTPRVVTSAPTQQRPNIVFIVADDLGHADIGYSEGNLQTPTPHIDKLAGDGIILNRHYANPICTPTRAALLTGRYSFQTGMQGQPIGFGQPWGLPLNFKIFPQYMKELNYSTTMLGKWHIGGHTRAFHPGARGFDYWLGYTEGFIHAFNYTSGDPVQNLDGRNLYENGYQVPQNCTNNHYLPDLLLEKFEQIVHNSDSSKPFYIHFATPLPRSATELIGTKVLPRQFTMPQFNARPAVASLSDEFPERKKQLAQIQALDDQVRRIVIALKNKGVLNNTIIVFISDNGGQSINQAGPNGVNHASNYPLRMFKNTLFEGGVRTLAFVWSPLLQRRRLMTKQLFHVTDWLPTLFEAAGGNPETLGNISGISQWDSLRKGRLQGPRTELVNNIDTVGNQYAMIYEHPSGVIYKLIGGNVFNNSYTGWERTEGTTATNLMQTPTPASIKCNFPWGVERSVCQPWVADCLFDLTNDPCETTNIAEAHTDILRLLRDKITVYNKTSIPAATKPYNAGANPALWAGWWVPFLDPVPVLQSPPCAAFNPSSAF